MAKINGNEAPEAITKIQLLTKTSTEEKNPLKNIQLDLGEPLFDIDTENTGKHLHIGTGDNRNPKISFYDSEKIEDMISKETSAREKAIKNLEGEGRDTETIKGNADAIALETETRINAIKSLAATVGIDKVSAPTSNKPQAFIKSITQTDGKLTGLATLDLLDDIIASTLGGKKAQKAVGGIREGAMLGNTLAKILSDLFGIGTFTVTQPSVTLTANISNLSDADFLEYGQEATINLEATFNSGEYPYGSSISSDPIDTGVTISNYGDDKYSNDNIKFTSTKDTTAQYSQDETPGTITYSDQTITSNDTLSDTITYTVTVEHTAGYTPFDADGKAVSDKAITAGLVTDNASISWYRAFFMGALTSEIIDELDTESGKQEYLSKLTNDSIRSLQKFKSIKGTYDKTIPKGSWGVLFAIPASLRPTFSYLRNGSYLRFSVTYIGEISLPDASGADKTEIIYNVYAYDADTPYEAAMNVRVQIS